MIHTELDENGKFAEFLTCYSYKLLSTKGTITKQASCFRTLYEERPDIYIKISIRMSTKQITGTRHFCPLDEIEIVDWLNYIQKVLNFSYKIKEFKRGIIKEGWEIQIIDLFNLQRVKLITTLIRYLYEDSYPYIVWDVLQLKNLQDYKKINPINLFNIVSQIYKEEAYTTVHSIHNFYTIQEPITDKRLKDWISNEDSLNSLGTPESDIRVELNKEEMVHLYPFNTEKFIKKFPERKATYDKILKIFKFTFGI